MDFLLELFHRLRDLESLIATAGYTGITGITAIIFIETGLLFPFLPGDSLLVMAGLASAQKDGIINLNVWTLGGEAVQQTRLAMVQAESPASGA